MESLSMKMVTVGLLCMSGLISAGGVITELKLDGDLKASGTTAPDKITAIGKTEYVPGVTGKALVLVNKPGQGVELFLSKGLPGDKGAISFWLSPLNWNYDDKSFQIFLGGFLGKPGAKAADINSKEPNRFCFYKYGNPHMDTGGLGLPWIFYNNNKPEYGCSVDGRKLSDWKQGKWHFVVLAWDKTGKKPVRRIWLDGTAQGGKIGKFDLSAPIMLRFGGFWGKKDGKTAIDNIKIWDNPPTEDQQTEIYENTMEKIHTRKEKK
jgi:hypothetical protein